MAKKVGRLEKHAAQLAALGHPIRLEMVRYVVGASGSGTKRAAAGAIAANVDLPASTASHHLKRLVDAGLLSSIAEGTFHYYAPEVAALRGLSEYLDECVRRGGKA